MKHQEEKCDCIFCQSKCPECRSREVEVDYIIRQGYHPKPDKIKIDSDMQDLTIRCSNCEKEFSSYDDKYEEEMSGLEGALGKMGVFGIDGIVRDKDGQISSYKREMVEKETEQ